MVHLSIEVLSLILIEALHTGSSSLLTLRSVNRAWYKITGRTPQLWTRLVLNRNSHFSNLKYPILHLRKSGALPIDVEIVLPDNVDRDVSRIEGIGNFLRSQTSNFRSFDLHAPTRDELEEFMFLVAEGRPAPLLESLKLRVRHRTPCDTVFGFGSLFTGFTPAPRIAHIDIPEWPLCPFPKSFPQLTNMTSFTINSMSDDFITIHKIILFLGSTPSLQHFVYKGRGVSDNPITGLYEPHVVHLPDLVTVDVTAPGAGGDLLCLINAPALTDARLEFCLHDFEPQAGYIIASLTEIVLLLSTHSRNLQHLTLEYTEFLETPGDFETIFNGISFPQLEEILLIATDITDETLMKAGKNSRLKRLELRNCMRVTGSGLLEFVQGRGSDFSLSLQGCRNLNITQEDVDAISELIHVEGLH